MNQSTTRKPITAAPTRAARSPSALPNDPGLDRLLADLRLGSTAKTIAVALVRNWAWYKPSCFPADRSIAEKVNKSPGHVQRCLRQLEAAGWIRREATSEIRSGRRIWLLWRLADDSQGAQPPAAKARGRASAPARSEQVVVEQEGPEREDDQPPCQRQRPEESSPAPSASDRSLAQALRRLIGQVTSGPCQEDWAPETPGDQPPSVPPAGTETVPRPAEGGRAAESTVGPPAVESGADRRVPEPTVAASDRPASAQPAFGAALANLDGLTAAEQQRLWELPEARRQQVLRWLELGDRICLGEARALLAPPCAPEPPPWSLGTLELLEGLPGRPDRVAHAAGRLAAELGDQRSYRYYLKLAESVCRRQHPASALVSAWREGVNPQSQRPGAVFATAWSREVRVPT